MSGTTWFFLSMAVAMVVMLTVSGVNVVPVELIEEIVGLWNF